MSVWQLFRLQCDSEAGRNRTCFFRARVNLLMGMGFLKASVLFFRKKVIPGEILQPFAAPVSFDDPGPLHEFIGAQQEIDGQHRQFEYESGDKAERNRIAPHIDGITDQPETCVSSGTEDACDQGRIDGGAHDIVAVDQQHIFQIVHCRVRQGSEAEYKRRDGEDDHAAYGSGDHGQLYQFGGVYSRAFHVVFPHHVAQQNTACAGCAEAEYGTEIADYDHQGIGGYRIRTEMPENDRVHREGNAP